MTVWLDEASLPRGFNGPDELEEFMSRPSRPLAADLAAFVRGENPDVGLLDASRLKAIPLYPLREPAVRMVAGWYQFLDAIGK